MPLDSKTQAQVGTEAATRRRLAASNLLTQIKKGVLVPANVDDPVHQRRRQARAALLAQIHERQLDGVVAQETAALLLGGRTLTEPSQVHLLVAWNAAGLKRGGPTHPERPSSHNLSPVDRRRALAARPIVRHRYDLADDDVTLLDKVPCTSLLRTAEDCARFLPPNRAFAVVDSLFAVACDAGDRPWDQAERIDTKAAVFRARLLDRLAPRKGERGVRQGLAVVQAASPWSQSVWESEVRRLCLAHGIRAPRPQMPVRTALGTRYVDNGWWEARCGHETDGVVKLGEDPEAARAMMAWRQELILDAGVRLLRSTPAEIADGAEFVSQLREFLPATFSEEKPVLVLMTRAERRRRSGG